ncbi:hypothetical protein TIFTF001_018023 [Ficus carica]|uniref:Uncharacterized protein n=1 Tax=Ficus carica TaxID=3494 RepID=A0AA88A3G5_FICCA|nr:hypothetical protein TIFTF001_018023 [Ficus carica]
MEGNWEEVQKIYEDDSRAPTLKITKSGQTALHLAVSDAKEDDVVELVAAIQKHGPELQSEALRIGNERGQAALHLAAAMGNVPMCECIANADRSLIGQHNIKGETPLFWAVLYGQKEAFRCLHKLCLSQSEQLALEILDEYEELVNLVDDKGESPLHTLARKPSCFRSGTDFRGWENILYSCTFVNKPKKEIGDHSPENNKKAFVDCSQLLTKAVGETLTTLGLGKKRTPNDEENQAYTANNRSLSTRAGGPSYGNSEDNIASRFDRQKEKHLLALHIADELAKHSSIYHDYNENPGESPGTEMEGDHSEITSVLNNEAKNGVSEIVDIILRHFPVAIHDADEDRKNMLLLAAENRHSEVYKRLLKYKTVPIVIHKVDDQGNTALH